MHKWIIFLLINFFFQGPFVTQTFGNNISINGVSKLLNSSSCLITSAFKLFSYDSITNEITIKKTFFILLIVAITLLFVGATFFFRGKRHRYLINEKKMMDSLINNIPDAIYFKNLQSKFIRVNKAQAELLGFSSPDEVIGKSDFDFFEHADEEYKREQEIIKTNLPIINRQHKSLLNGEAIYLSDTKAPLISSNGKCIGTVGITRNITDFKKAEVLMLENQTKLKALFENAPLAIFRLDKNMKVIEYNVRFRKMFGYSDTDDMDNITKADLLVDPELGSLIMDTVIENKEVNTEIMLKRKNGEQFIANFTLALLEEGFNEISVEGIVDDITQVAIARDEIIKAKDKAIEADQLKSLFLANMSHEIRTPMNAIIGFTNMLRENDLSTEERDSYIDVVQGNGNSLMILIDSIVDFSKLETDQMVVSIGEFNFHSLFDSVYDYTAKLLLSQEKQNIKLIKTLPEKPEIRINTDRHRLNQVMIHLITNAVKFTDEGEIELGYKLDNNKISIFVRDTGIGIPKDKHETIFKRFAKINNDKSRLYSGTGIGLTISRGLMELMNGQITVDSKPSEGSLFQIKMNLK